MNNYHDDEGEYLDYDEERSGCDEGYLNYEDEPVNELTPLNEMATLISKRDGFGIKIVLNSEDHEPALMHVTDISNDKLIARVLVPDSEPQDEDDIKLYGSNPLPRTLKRVILRALRSRDKKTGCPMWMVADLIWRVNHPEN